MMPIETFLTAPINEIQPYAPATLVLAAGGTRRSAVLHGIQPNTTQYVEWARQQMLHAIDLVLSLGVKHVFVPVMVDGNYDEQTSGYREHLLEWIQQGLAGPEALQDYRQRAWQVRLIGAEFVPKLASAAKRLKAETPRQDARCVWFTVMASSESAWDLLFQTIQAKQAYTYRDAVRAMYGQDVPTDDVLLLDFGKPQVFASAVPPLLVCKMHCYWRQSPGYNLDEETVRRIFYDYAFNRRTWLADKTGRAEQVLHYAAAYDDPPVVGLGTRLGPFWYPAPIEAVRSSTPEPE